MGEANNLGNVRLAAAQLRHGSAAPFGPILLSETDVSAPHPLRYTVVPYPLAKIGPLLEERSSSGT